jgi:adenylate cyclase
MRVFRRLWQLTFTPYHPLRRLAGGLVVGLVVGGLAVWGLNIDLLHDVRTRFNDLTYAARPTSGIVTIIAIDDASLAAYGRSPVEWPRSLHTQLVKFLDDAEARVIAFDIVFVDPSEDDAELAAAMLEARNVIQPVVGDTRGATATTRAGELFTYFDLIYPQPVLADASMGVGHIMVRPDGDGYVRRVPLFVAAGGDPMPQLGLAAYIEYLRLVPDMVQIDPDAVRFARRTLYTGDYSEMRLSFFGPPSHPNQPDSAFPVYSFVDVLEGRVPPEAFYDKIVLIGVLDAGGLPDNYPTPSASSDNQMYGVEIHASVIETVHQSLPEFQARINWKLDLGLFTLPLYKGTTSLPLRDQPLREQQLIAFLMAVGAGIVLPFLRWYVDLVLVAVVYVVYFVWAAFSYTLWGRVIELLFPALTLGLAVTGSMIVIYVFEERRRNQINDLFSRYVSAEIAQKIVEVFDRGKLELGGEEREITVLFADVRGFTPLSEGLRPAEVLRLLNVFLEEMNVIVMKYGGAINKYMGDNLMAFWNAPYPQDDHAWLATQAGLEMLAAIDRLNTTQRFKTPVQFGIGINTGPAVVGNIGSRKRLEYTPIGDTVNVASRLSGAVPGGACYIGTRTFGQIRDRVRPVDVHHLKLKGKQDEVEVYELRLDSIAKNIS